MKINYKRPSAIHSEVRGCLALAAILLASALPGYPAEHHKHSPQLEGVDPNTRVEVIVQFNGVPTDRHYQKVQSHGGVLKADLNVIHGGHYSLPASEIESLAADPDIEYISPNYPVQGALAITGPAVRSNIANIAGYTGIGVTVAVIDSGVSDMPEFHNGTSRIVYQQSFVPNVPNLNLNCPSGGGQVGVWFSSSLNVQGGLPPYNASVVIGSLPPGLSLNAATGNVTGVPTASVQQHQFIVGVADSMGHFTMQSCNMNVNQASYGPPQQLHLGCAGGGSQTGAWYDGVANVQGGYPPYRFSISSGSLPAGLSLDSAAGAISGTPTAPTNGGQNFTVQVMDSLGNSASQNCNMNVSPAQQIQMTGTQDQYGHGTHVTGIITSNGNNTAYIGIAPGVNIVNLRVLDQNGNGTDSSVIQGIEAAISLARTYNIRVINLSLGRPVFESYTVDPLCQAVEQAWKAGIVVVTAAGNQGRNNSAGTQGYATINAPGNDPYVITVGAMKTEGSTNRANSLIASYSSKGPTLIDHIAKPDIVAPGNTITSTMQGTLLRQEYPANAVSGDFFILSGTSMATPVVSGAAALLIQQNPSITPDQVKARLMLTASKTFPTVSYATDPTTGTLYTSYYDLFTVGAGYVDVWAALTSSALAPAGVSAQSPAVHYNPLTGMVQLVSGANVVWGNNIVWGDNVVWGSNVLIAGTNIVWGNGLVWGSSTPQAFNVVWGDAVVWGTGSPAAAESVNVAIMGEQ